MGNVKKGGVCESHDPMPKRSATPRIALMNNNREAKRALRGGLQWSHTVNKLQSQTTRSTCRGPLLPFLALYVRERREETQKLAACRALSYRL